MANQKSNLSQSPVDLEEPSEIDSIEHNQVILNNIGNVDITHNINFRVESINIIGPIYANGLFRLSTTKLITGPLIASDERNITSDRAKH